MSKAIIVLVEPKALDRECLLETFGQDDALAFHAVADPAGVADLVATGCRIDAVIVSIGERTLQSRPLVRQLLQIGTTCPCAALMVLSARDDIGQVLKALQFGLRGYLTKSMSLEMMRCAIRFVCAGGTFVPASALQAAYERGGTERCVPGARPPEAPDELTPRQAEVLHWLRKGLANKAIAYRLRIREGTVKAHVQTIMRKVGAVNRTQVVHLTSHGDTAGPVLLAEAAGAMPTTHAAGLK
ncbi:MAG TPA: response regulator transcription factor [Azospirillum sp.]|nr:response regulator transcription factor [Azospirillum sp.]